MSGEDMGIHTFTKAISLIVNVIARLEFELAEYKKHPYKTTHEI